MNDLINISLYSSLHAQHLVSAYFQIHYHTKRKAESNIMLSFPDSDHYFTEHLVFQKNLYLYKIFQMCFMKIKYIAVTTKSEKASEMAVLILRKILFYR